MTPSEVVPKIVAEQALVPITDVKSDTKIIDDLKLDSLDMVEMVMEIEDAFGLDMDTGDEAFRKIVTVQDLIDYTEKRVKEEAT